MTTIKLEPMKELVIKDIMTIQEIQALAFLRKEDPIKAIGWAVANAIISHGIDIQEKIYLVNGVLHMDKL